MNVAHQSIIETLPHIPVGLESPQALGFVALGAAAYLGARYVYDKTDGSAYAEFPNAALLDEVVRPAPDKARRSTLRSTALATVGLTALGIGLVGQPYSEQTEVTDKAATVVIVDESFSMSKTLDIGQQSRLEAVRMALQTMSLEGGQMAIIEAGANNFVAMPMTSEPTTQTVTDALAFKDKVDPNGTDLVEAMQLGSTLIPADAEKKTLVILTDGTVQDPTASLQEAATNLQDSGVKIETIAVGTPSAEYQISASSPVVQSGVQTEKLQLLDNEVTVVSTVNDLNTTVNNVLSDTNKLPVKHRWYGLEVVGGALAALGLARLVKKAIVGR